MSISKRVLLTIITIFVVIFFLFMSLTIYGTILTAKELRNDKVDGTEMGRKIAYGVANGFEVLQDASGQLLEQLGKINLPALLAQPVTDAQMTQALSIMEENGVQVGEDAAAAQTAIQETLASDAYQTAEPDEQLAMLVMAVEASAQQEGSVFRLTGKPRMVAIYAPERQTDQVTTMIEWCTYCKYAYRLFEQFPTAMQLRGYDMLLVSEWREEDISLEELTRITQLGMMIVFAQMPDPGRIQADPALMDLLGIEEVRAEAMEIDKVHLFADFYLSADRIYERDDDYGETDDMILTIPYYHLRPGYEVYAVAELPAENGVPLASEEMPPLLWRTVTGRSRLFCICTDVFSGDALLGTLSAFAAQATDLYVYPVVNAQTVNLLGFPYMNRENDQVLEQIYGHHADTLASSVLWPAVIQSTYMYSQATDYYISACMDYQAPELSTDMMAGYFINQIQHQLGMMALNLQQHSDVPLETLLLRNQEFISKYAPQWVFSTVFSGEFSTDELIPYLNDPDSLLGQVSVVMTNAQGDQPLIRPITDHTLQVQLTSNGFQHEAQDDLRMLAYQTALAMDNQYIDMGRVLYPESSEDYWNRLSIIWSSGVTYYRDFQAFDYVQTPELALRAATLLSLDYSFSRQADGIHIEVEGLEEGDEAFFVLRLQGKKPEKITGGELTQLTETSYLLRAQQSEIIIEEKPCFTLGMPN